MGWLEVNRTAGKGGPWHPAGLAKRGTLIRPLNPAGLWPYSGPGTASATCIERHISGVHGAFDWSVLISILPSSYATVRRSACLLLSFSSHQLPTSPLCEETAICRQALLASHGRTNLGCRWRKRRAKYLAHSRLDILIVRDTARGITELSNSPGARSASMLPMTFWD